MKGSFTREDKFRVSKECANWSEIVSAFESFPMPQVQYDSESDLAGTAWIFRGHKTTKYSLEPTIERVSGQKPDSWAELEWQALKEFRSKARMHLAPSLLPPGDKTLDWLALMRHYGVPTRLLDFSSSPYIALYFALRGRLEEEESPAEVWAINAGALLDRAGSVSIYADREEIEWEAKKTGKQVTFTKVSLCPSDAASGLDILKGDDAYWDRVITAALAPSQIRIRCFNESGFVLLASPPVENPRLSSQQGVFLFNAAKALNFEDSLFKMMNGHADNWCRLFRIPPKMVRDFEERLFQLNIHDLSLFPDIDGLAGLIRQKARLHWFPKESHQ
jgi:hypothetical protein